MSKKNKQFVRKSGTPIITGQQQFHYQVQTSPFPPAEILEKYEAVNEGFAERIMRMTEANNQSRIEQGKTALKAQIWEVRLGQIFALIIGLAGLSAAVAIAYFGYPVASGFIGIGGLGSLVGAFIVRQKDRK